MVEKKTQNSVGIELEGQDIEDILKNRNHLLFFLERSSETIERTLTIVEKLQQEINQLKDSLSKADNEFGHLAQSREPNKKAKN